MKRFQIGVLAGILVLSIQCATVPITGRKQLLIMPESEMVQMSLTSYQDFLKENKLSADAAATKQGHEIAHAVARHGNERMSQQLMVQAGSAAAAYALKDKPETTRTLLGTAIGAGANYGVVLPFSRKHELEADRLGLIFMTIAGYSPEEAIPFWTRMAGMGSGEKPKEFMSTHPSDEHRIQQIRDLLPEVRKYKK